MLTQIRIFWLVYRLLLAVIIVFHGENHRGADSLVGDMKIDYSQAQMHHEGNDDNSKTG